MINLTRSEESKQLINDSQDKLKRLSDLVEEMKQIGILVEVKITYKKDFASKISQINKEWLA